MRFAIVFAVYLVSASAFQANAQGSGANAANAIFEMKEFNDEQNTFIGRLGTIMSVSRNCNMALNAEVIKLSAKQAFGKAEFNYLKALSLLLAADGYSTMSDSMTFGSAELRERVKECAKMARLYGPAGTVIKGALEP